MGSPLTSVRNWDQGVREPSLEMAARLASALGVTLDALVAGVYPDKEIPKSD